MATPLLPHEVLQLDNSNYMELLVFTFRDRTKITSDNYLGLFEEANATVHIEDKAANKVQFKFKSDNVLACSGNFSFKQGKLDGFMYNIVPVSYFKKRVCRKQYQRVLAMFTKISEVDTGRVETITDTMTKFHLSGGTLTVTGGPHVLTGTQMVTIVFDK